MSTTVNAGQNYTLGISLKGTTVSATLSNANGGFQAVVGHSFNASGVDGNFGLLAVSGTASFDDVRVKTNDRAFVQPAGGANLFAAEPQLMTDSASTVTQADLHSAVTEAMLTWTETLGDGDARLAGFGDVQITLGDLAGDALGYAEGRRIWIDRNAAGYGWSSAGGTMDLVTVVTHELGHVLGFEHEDEGMMAGRLEAGVTRLLEAAGFDADPDAAISDAQLLKLARKAVELKFDLDGGTSGTQGTVDWQSGSGSELERGLLAVCGGERRRRPRSRTSATTW